jgi:hypothetical protein
MNNRVHMRTVLDLRRVVEQWRAVRAKYIPDYGTELKCCVLVRRRTIRVWHDACALKFTLACPSPHRAPSLNLPSTHILSFFFLSPRLGYLSYGAGSLYTTNILASLFASSSAW